MALKSVLDTLEGVDEALKAHYVEEDGKFHLDLGDTARDHRDVLALRKAYDSEKEAGRAAKTAAQKAKDDLAAALKDKPDEAALLKLRQNLEAERDEWKGKAEAAEGKLTGVTRDRQLQDALQAAGITEPAFIKAATAMLGGSVKMDGDKAVVETDMGPLAVTDHVKRWAASEGKAFVAAPAGGGSKGSDKTGPKAVADMGDAERLALAREGKLKSAARGE